MTLAGTDAKAGLSALHFERLRQVVESEIGIAVDPGKRVLVTGRLQRLARAHGYESVNELCAAELGSPTPALVSELADYLSTNHTYFYREPDHFNHFAQTVLPQWIAQLRAGPDRDLRIWCAAASTGEEPYTLAMLMRRALSVAATSWRAGVLATDISTRALATARLGEYDADAVLALPEAWRANQFLSAGPGRVRVSPTLRDQVTYRRFNLSRDRWPFKRRFHAIFCRNVLIYFNGPQRVAVARRLHEQLEIGGTLYVGAAETLPPTPGLERVAASTYRRIA